MIGDLIMADCVLALVFLLLKFSKTADPLTKALLCYIHTGVLNHNYRLV